MNKLELIKAVRKWRYDHFLDDSFKQAIETVNMLQELGVIAWKPVEVADRVCTPGPAISGK